MIDTGSSVGADSPSSAQTDDDEVMIEATSGAYGRDPGLGLLLDLVRRGQQDPWDLDIVALTDQYLAALDSDLDARDLGHVARMIFYAAALVRLKAQHLAEREAARQRASVEAFEQGLDDLADALGQRRGLLPGDQPLVYPEGADARGVVGGLIPRERRPRERGLTLFDLISALRGYDDRLAAQELEAQAELDISSITVEDCVRTAHEDHLDEDIITVRGDLGERFADAAERVSGAGVVTDVSVDLEALITPRRSRAASYLALLFLAQEEEVHLEQAVCYGALSIRPGPHWGEVRAGVRKVEADEVDKGTIDEAAAEEDAFDDDAASDDEASDDEAASDDAASDDEAERGETGEAEAASDDAAADQEDVG